MKCRRQKNNQSKDPNEPVKPPKPYIRYSRLVWEKVSSENPGMNIGQIGNSVGRLWRNLPLEDKEIFNQEYKEDMLKYEQEMRQYFKSDLYLDWLKKNDDNSNKLRETPKKQTVDSEKVENSQELSERSYIQAELDSDEDTWHSNMETESSTRFYRNHELMLELFSDTRIPSQTENQADNQSHTSIESDIEEAVSHIHSINAHHIRRLAEIRDRRNQFASHLEIENQKLFNLISSASLRY